VIPPTSRAALNPILDGANIRSKCPCQLRIQSAHRVTVVCKVRERKRSRQRREGPPSGHTTAPHEAAKGFAVGSTDMHQLAGKAEKAAAELHHWYPKRY